MERLPDVGVVIPTYNRAALLRAALESVLAQTMPAREIVVVDDGSTDETPQVVEAMQEAGAPITYVRRPHTNRRGEVRNAGVTLIRGDLVTFLDSDDLWRPERLERQVESLRREPAAGFAFCNVHRFDDSGLIGRVPCLLPGARYDGQILGDLLEEPLAVSSTLLVRREAFEQVGGFADLRMNEDYELTLRLAARYPAAYVPEVLVLMREHPGRTSSSEQEMPLLDYLTIVRRFLRDHPGLPPGIRARARRGMANVHLKLARLYLEAGDKVAARRHLVTLLRLRPWDRRAISAGLRLLTPLPIQPGA